MKYLNSSILSWKENAKQFLKHSFLKIRKIFNKRRHQTKDLTSVVKNNHKIQFKLEILHRTSKRQVFWVTMKTISIESKVNL